MALRLASRRNFADLGRPDRCSICMSKHKFSSFSSRWPLANTRKQQVLLSRLSAKEKESDSSKAKALSPSNDPASRLEPAKELRARRPVANWREQIDGHSHKLTLIVRSQRQVSGQ